ncbi:MAG: dihydroorotate dehydrogenase electron transfer subunit [Veillonellaceae bacterium]|nr:dihydroorotate dehydrogenase electron transfer subunit [Veillonellaceae bacterium]
MSGYVELGRVVENEQIGSDVWCMVVYAPKQAKEAKVGQFCDVRVAMGTMPLLRRPISYAGFNAQEGTITLLYRVVGKGTELMTQLSVDDTIDCLGPLGNGFTIPKRVLLVGGGVGIAPMVCASNHLPEGTKATVLLGFRNKEEAFWADLFKQDKVDVHITTDDGSLGTKGFPTAVLPSLCANTKFDSILVCGPTPMMKGVAQVAHELGLSCQVSLENRMGCGIGGCLGCAVDGQDGRRYKVCMDGPVFDSEEVGF